jgi:hypothetical protein
MILTVAALLVIGAVVFTLFVRQRDLPAPEPVSPVEHLEERKARIYDGLRDLTFEFRVGKLSEADYQRTKAELQAELKRLEEEIQAVLEAEVGRKAIPAPPRADIPATEESFRCLSCGAIFDRPMKFCGECGQPMRRGEG